MTALEQDPKFEEVTDPVREEVIADLAARRPGAIPRARLWLASHDDAFVRVALEIALI